MLLVPTQPNLPLTFVPPPRYWITIGDSYSAGQALDPSRAAPKQELVFSGEDEVYVALLADNTLTDPVSASFARAALLRFAKCGGDDGTPEE